ncbi:magnesium transporter [Amycolatopsis sp. NPDC051106]|uniref:magnesium transporter n=1 Tax=unclassified Amycolatopsis TaxID=2618356 RepID=UPI0034149F88
MNTLLTLAVLLTLAAAWHALKRRIKEGPKARRVPSRKATMFAVMLVLGLQAIATAPAASAAACGEAPNPERPGAGMVGAIDPPEGHGEPNSAYIDYGYAGMVWNTFETDCSGINLTPAGSTLDSWGGNQLFNLGKNIVGATNSLHYTVLEGGLLNPIYAAVKSGAEKVYNNIYAQLFGLVALILSIMMFRNIWRGDLAAVSKRALYALAGIWLAASSLAMLRYFDPIDKAIVQTTTNIQAGFVDESGDRIVRDILPTQLHTQIVYNNWLRGEFGTPTAPQAEQFGKPLLDAQAFTRNQLVNGDDGNQGVIDGKKNAYKDISTKLGPATGYFTGEAGGRTGAGFLSLGQALVYSLFQLLAKASVLLAQVLIRLFALTAPLIGLVALLHPEILRRVLKVAGGVAFNLVVLSVLAGVHALLLQAIFDAGNSLNMLTQMVLAGLITVLLFMVGRPVRRLWQMVEMSVSMVGAAVPSPGGGIFSRFKRNRNGPTPQDEFWQNVRDTDDVVDGEQRGPLGATAGGGRFRPEATIFANAQRLDNTSGAGRPAAAWSGAWPGAINGGPAGALPAGGRPGSPVYGQYNPANGDPGDYVVVGAGGRPTLRREESRRVDTSPVADRRWTDEPEPVVVPSDLRTPESGFNDYTPQDVPRTPGVRAQPRRVDPEVVAGKPVFVLYRPSRGIEVREEPRDTDQVMGR